MSGYNVSNIQRSDAAQATRATTPAILQQQASAVSTGSTLRPMPTDHFPSTSAISAAQQAQCSNVSLLKYMPRMIVESFPSTPAIRAAQQAPQALNPQDDIAVNDHDILLRALNVNKDAKMDAEMDADLRNTLKP